MAINKSSEFNPDTVKLALLAKALGHPARISILEILASKEECMCGNIATLLPLAQSTVSQHLKMLKNAGLIKGKISGASVCYDIDAEVIEECCGLFKKFSEKMLSPVKFKRNT